jgi:hypothetical protein
MLQVRHFHRNNAENMSPDESENEKKKRMFFPFSYCLFKSKLPDSPGFWKKYVTP